MMMMRNLSTLHAARELDEATFSSMGSESSPTKRYFGRSVCMRSCVGVLDVRSYVLERFTASQLHYQLFISRCGFFETRFPFQRTAPLPHPLTQGEPHDVDVRRNHKLHNGDMFRAGLRGFMQPIDADQV